MNKIKKVIAILVVLLLIVLISILILNKNLQQKQQESLIEYEPDVSEDFIKELSTVEDYSTFFSVEKMLKSYIRKVQLGNQQAIYKLMDSTYILENNITQENVLEYVADIAPYASDVKIRKIYEQKDAENAVYYIYCILEKEHEGKEFYFNIYKDEINSTYSVVQSEKQAYEKQISNVEQELESKRIEENDYNKTYFVNSTEEEIVTKYFEDFLENALYYPDYAYTLLNSEYKNTCFPTLQDFKDYIENKREIFLSYDTKNLKSFGEFENMQEYLNYIGTAKNLELESYQIRMKEDYNRYICIDTEGNYYIFYATSPFNYTVILDNYTIPTEDFTEEYNEKTDKEKGVLNIKRFFMGIDDKNYGYSYSVLSESFKNNKYPTKDDFINYAKQNFFEENEIEYISYEKETGVYIYKIKITDATGKSSEERAFNIIVKLNNGTDFEMSFGEG